MLAFTGGLAGLAQTTFQGPGTNWILSQHWTAGVPNSSTNAVINSGNVVLLLSNGGNPYEAGWLYINGGSLGLSSAGRLRTVQTMIAASSGQTASASLSDAGSSWTVTRDLGIGGGGFGTFTIHSGATLALTATDGAGDIYLGYDSGGTGVLNIGQLGGQTTAGLINFYNADSKIRLGSASGNGTINFNQTNTFVLGAALVSSYFGRGYIAQRGTGTTFLAGDNSAYTGMVEVLSGRLITGGNIGASVFGTEAGSVLELAVNDPGTVVNNATNTIFSGSGVVRKTGTGTLLWGTGSARFALGSGSLLDIQEGTFQGGSSANEVWTDNRSDLNVASGAVFWGNEAHIRVDALTGGGTIGVGWGGQGSLTVGVDGGSGTFTGLLTNGASAGHLTKEGSGTQVLSRDATYTGSTTVNGGTLVLGGASQTSSIQIAAGGVLESQAYTLTTTPLTISGLGTLRLVPTALGATLSMAGTTYNLGSGSLIQLQSGTFVSHPEASDNWSNNRADLNVAAGAEFLSTRAALRVDSLTGSGIIGFGWNGAGSLTIGVDNGSGTFNGTLEDSNTFTGDYGRLIKEGTGTQILAGNNTYTGGTWINGGTLQFGTGNTGGSVVGDIYNNGSLILNHGTNRTLSSNISGTGTLTKQGAGTLTLTAHNTYTGATTISAGTLVMTGGYGYGDTWTPSIHIAAGAVLEVAALGEDMSFKSGLPSHNGQVVTGGGTWRKTGTSRFHSPTQALESGALVDVREGQFHVVQVDWLANRSDLNVEPGAEFLALLSDVRVDVLTGAGQIEAGDDTSGTGDSGSLTFGVDNGSGVFHGVLANYDDRFWHFLSRYIKAGTGTQVLLGENTFTGGLAIDGGTLQVGNGGTTGSLVSNITNNAALVFNRSNDSAYAGNITGAGTLTKQGAGVLAMAGDHTYSGTTSVQQGRLVLAGTSSSSRFLINSGAVLELNTAADRTYAANTLFDGGGTLRKTGPGTSYLNGAVRFALGSGARLEVQGGNFNGSNGANEDWTGNLADLDVAAGATFWGNEGTIRVDALTGGGTVSSGWGGQGGFTFGVDNGSGTFSGVLANGSSAGRFIKAGTGTQVLTGENTFTGGLTINSGLLRLGTGGTTGSVTGSVTNNAALLVDRSNISALSGVSGTGTLTKRGAGILMLSGASYTGATAIEGGTIRLWSGGISSSAIAIAAGAMLDVNPAVGASVTLANNPTVTGTGTLLKSGEGAASLSTEATIALGSGGLIDVQGGTFLARGTWDQNLADLSVAGGASFDLASGYARVDALNGGGAVRVGLGNFAMMVIGHDGGSGTFAGSINGSGYLVKNGMGTQVFTGDVGLSDGMGIMGTVQIGSGGETGSLSAEVYLNIGSALVFDRAGTLAHAGVISGGGAVAKRGAGTLVLEGENTFTGGLTVEEGLVKVGADSRLGVGTVTLDGGGISFAQAFDDLRALVLGGSGGTLEINDGAVHYAQPITGAGALTKTGGGQLRLLGASTHTGGTRINEGLLQLEGDASIAGDIVNNAALVFNGGEREFSGTISGSGSLSMMNGGFLILTGNNSYTGATLISGGLLLQQHANALGANGGVHISSGGMLDTGGYGFDLSRLYDNEANSGRIRGGGSYTFDSVGNRTVHARLEGSASLVKAGSGTLTLSGAGSYSGGTFINGGTLVLGHATPMGAGGFVTVAASATLDVGAYSFNLTRLAGTGTVTGSGTLGYTTSLDRTLGNAFAGAVSLTKGGSGTLILTGNSTSTGAIALNTGTLRVGAGGTSGAVAGNIANNAALVFDRSDDSTYAGVISGTGAVTKLGGGRLTLTGNSTGTGAITLGAGTLEIGAGGDSGAVAANITNEGTLVFNRATYSSYGGVISGGGAVEVRGGSLLLTGANTYTGGTTVHGQLIIGENLSGNVRLAGGTLSLSPSSNMTYAGVISGTGSLSTTGNQGITLTGHNTFSGEVTVDSSTLIVGAGGTSGAIDGSGQIYLSRGGWFGFNRSDDITFAGSIAGNGGFRKMGSGTLTLTGHINLFMQYPATIHAGTLRIAGGGWIVGRIANEGILMFDRAGNFTHGGDISGGGKVVQHGGDTLTLTGSNTFWGGLVIENGAVSVATNGNLGTGPAMLSGGRLVTTGTFITTRALALGGSGGTLETAAGTTLTWNGAISGAGDLTKLGAGTLLLGGNNSYAGTTHVNAGTLRLGAATALSPNTTLQVAAGATFDANGYAQTLGGLSGSGGLDVGSAGLTVTSSAPSIYAGALTGSGGLTLNGGGILTLTGNNTFTGNTTITAGKLVVNGSLGDTLVSVGTGATIGGNGSFGGLVTFAGGAHLAPGNSPDTITFTDGLTLGNGMVLDFELGTVSDLIRVSGGVLTGTTGTNGVTLHLTDSGGFAPATYTLFNFSGATLSDFSAADFTINTALTGYDFNFALTGSSFQLIATAIPEPSTYAALAGLGALGLAVWHRRRMRALP